MSRQFRAIVHLTVNHADFVNHDGLTDQSRREELPIGSAVAIDNQGDVFIARTECRALDHIQPSKGMMRVLYRDYWVFANINVNCPEKAGPYWHAVLNALPAEARK